MNKQLTKRISAALMALCLLMTASCAPDDTQETAEPAPPVVTQSDIQPSPTDLPTEKVEVQSVSDPLVMPGTEYSEGDISDAGFEENSGYWTLSEAAAISDASALNSAHALRMGGEQPYEAHAVQYISGLEPGYYYLETKALNQGGQEHCYVYGRGSGQGRCMTSVPRTISDGLWITVTVRGIEVGDDGLLEVGVCAKGEGQYVNLDRFELHYENDQSRRYESLYGGAVSWLDWVEDKGGRYYYADGTEADALQIMAENGCNIVRLELYNNPGDYTNARGERFPAGYKDADAIYDLALRAHAKGMKIQLSFMYSDYWGNEAVPWDWLEKIEGTKNQTETTEILTQCIYEYTSGFMKRLAAAGIYPEFVSLGNEMQGGIIQPYSCTYTTQADMDAFCAFMDAGWRAVKEVSPSSRIVLHLSCNADDMFWSSKRGTGIWFFELCEKYNIKYDVIGISYYPFWAQTNDAYAVKKALDTGDLVEWCNMMIDRFDRDILIMESGINWGSPGQLSNNGAYRGIYKYTPEDQRDFMYELINALKSVKDGRCLGDLYWDPVLVSQPGIGFAVIGEKEYACANVVETTTFFDYDHKALPVLDAYRYNTVSDGSAMLYGIVTGSDGTPAADRSFTLTLADSEYTLVTDRFGAYCVRVEAESGSASVDGESVDVGLSPGQQLRLDLCA